MNSNASTPRAFFTKHNALHGNINKTHAEGHLLSWISLDVLQGV